MMQISIKKNLPNLHHLRETKNNLGISAICGKQKKAQRKTFAPLKFYPFGLLELEIYKWL